jgi:tRNA 2-thiouridine synthesizing protein D
VKFLIIVNESPWGSGLSLSACRFVTAVIASGSQVHAIFFREDGVYNAVKGAMVDSGTPDLSDQWDAFNRNHGTRLLLCSSSTQRRLDKSVDQPFEISGLTEMLELTTCCDRVVSF